MNKSIAHIPTFFDIFNYGFIMHLRRHILNLNTLVVDYSVPVRLPSGYRLKEEPVRRGRFPLEIRRMILVEGRDNLTCSLHPLLRRSSLHFDRDVYLDYHMAEQFVFEANRGKINIPSSWENCEIPCIAPILNGKGDRVFFPVIYCNLFWGIKILSLYQGIKSRYKIVIISPESP